MEEYFVMYECARCKRLCVSQYMKYTVFNGLPRLLCHDCLVNINDDSNGDSNDDSMEVIDE